MSDSWAGCLPFVGIAPKPREELPVKKWTRSLCGWTCRSRGLDLYLFALDDFLVLRWVYPQGWYQPENIMDSGYRVLNVRRSRSPKMDRERIFHNFWQEAKLEEERVEFDEDIAILNSLPLFG